MAKAFSLVELSIVLVILGLLTGGILSGQSLIRAAELRGVVMEFHRYSTAMMTFRDRYMALPGDFRDATRFWGKDNAACSSHTGTATPTGTCNGNGDGMVNAAAAAGATSEMFQSWKQMALAGLIEGTYSGVAGSESTTQHLIAVNAPPSKIGDVAWGFGYQNNTAGGSDHVYAYDYSNALTIGKVPQGNWADDPFISAQEAWNIDSKLDDGRAGYGKVHGMRRSCTNSVNAFDYMSDYQLASTGQVCALFFRFMN